MKKFKKININLINQQGFLLPAAIFLLVVLAGLGAYAVNITTVQQTTATQDIQAIRAYHLARAGAELSAYYLMQSSSVPTSCPANTNNAITLDGFNVAISCSLPFSTLYSEEGGDKEIGMYSITSTASYGTVNTLNFVQREIKVDLSKCRDTVSDTACP